MADSSLMVKDIVKPRGRMHLVGGEGIVGAELGQGLSACSSWPHGQRFHPLGHLIALPPRKIYIVLCPFTDEETKEWEVRVMFQKPQNHMV